MHSSPVSAPAWITRFAIALSRFGLQENLDRLSEFAAERHPALGHIDPEAAARAEAERRFQRS
jgi:hypothetical protein